MIGKKLFPLAYSRRFGIYRLPSICVKLADARSCYEQCNQGRRSSRPLVSNSPGSLGWQVSFASDNAFQLIFHSVACSAASFKRGCFSIPLCPFKGWQKQTGEFWRVLEAGSVEWKDVLSCLCWSFDFESIQAFMETSLFDLAMQRGLKERIMQQD